jgi:predicted Rossmann fold nucleotide-binding protein DprA/Smf involved in DNA uptake
MEYSEALAAKIEVRITELKSEIDAHERALAALRGREGASNGAASAENAATSRRRRTTTPRAGNRRPRRSRTTSAEAVFDALKDGQDQASVIAKQFGVSPASVRSRLQQLEEAGRVSRTGNRRSTRWRSHAG